MTAERAVVEIETHFVRLWPLPVWLLSMRVAGGRRCWSIVTPWGQSR
jgi:hypothetical protein